MKHHETRARASRARRRGFHLDRLIDAAIVEPPIEPQCAKARVAQLTSLAGVLDDRDDARTQPAQAGAEWQWCREGRYIGGEVARRFIEPAAEIRRHVGLADEGEDVAGVHAAQRADRPAPLVLDKSAQDHVGAWRDVAFEPVTAARARDVGAVAALRDDPLETVFSDDVEEWLAVLIQVLGHRDRVAADAERRQPAAALLERAAQQRPAIFVQEVERDEDRPAPAFGGLRAEPAGEKVVARTPARVAHDDLAVEDGAFRYRQLREL